MLNRTKNILKWFLDDEVCVCSQKSLTNELTGFPVIPAFYGQLRKYLKEEEKNIGVIYLDIVDFSQIELEYGEEICEKILASLSKILRNISTNTLRKEDKIGISNQGGDDFVIFLAGLDDEFLRAEKELIVIANRIKSAVVTRLNKQLHVQEVLDLHLGHAVIVGKKVKRVENSVYKTIKEAAQVAKDKEYNKWRRKRDILAEIIANEEIRILFQPLISLQSGEIVGYEALTRGPKDSYFERPDQLFDFAKETNLLLDLERLCRKQALVKAESFLAGKKLSLNVSPEVIEANDFKKGVTQEIISKLGIEKQNIIFEITEKTAINNFDIFHKTLKHYYEQGYQIAVDDVGSGYANLQTISKLHPQYIKLDMSLIRNINLNSTKEALIRALIDFAHQVNTKVVAEGIETYDELEKLIELGVDYGQGYLIQHPVGHPEPITDKLRRFITWKNNRLESRFSINELDIEDIVRHDATLQKEDLVEEAVKYFEEDPYLNGIVIVDEKDYPIGLVMKDELYYRLGKRFGVSLFIKKPIKSVMDKHPLIVEANDSIERVSKKAMSRDENKLYHYIIVTKDEKYIGTLSVRRLLESMTKLQVDIAQNLNPLTGLPGNTLIQQRLDKILKKKQPFAILYIDLDNFKAFNDHYGFENGDQLIKLTANILNEVADGEDFIGHIGGDDFLIVTTPKKGEELSKRIIKRYEREVAQELMVNENLTTRSSVNTSQNQALLLHQPTISVAVITNQDYDLKTRFEVGRLAAQLKDKVKKIEGSNYLINS